MIHFYQRKSMVHHLLPIFCTLQLHLWWTNMQGNNMTTGLASKSCKTYWNICPWLMWKILSCASNNECSIITMGLTWTNLSSIQLLWLFIQFTGIKPNFTLTESLIILRSSLDWILRKSTVKIKSWDNLVGAIFLIPFVQGKPFQLIPSH